MPITFNGRVFQMNGPWQQKLLIKVQVFGLGKLKFKCVACLLLCFFMGV